MTRLLSATEISEAIARMSRSEFTHCMAELYRGNGWIVSEIKESGHLFLGISWPDAPDLLALLVRTSHENVPLTADHVRSELERLEQVGEQHRCDQFALVSTSGFTRGTGKYRKFNLLLQDLKDINELRSTFRTDNYRKARIQLFAHNQNTYGNVKKLLAEQRAVAVVQATGTGKSYLIARLLQDMTNLRRIVLAPSWYILNQLKETILWDKEIIYLTYSKLMFMDDSELSALSAEFIVLDEFHRCGAEEWGRGVQNLLKNSGNARIFGTSATPVRYLDDARDMSDELFDKNVAENLNLAQAIVKRILPMPKYVSALYTIEEDTEALRERIRRSAHREEIKAQLMEQIDSFALDWERSSGIPEILRKHITTRMNKFIVFCREEEHLHDMITTVTQWFESAGYADKVDSYCVLSSDAKSPENLRQFKKANDRTRMHLLFSINMLNEGLHIDEVQGVILLRPTQSPNIFYQQIGRCLKVGSSQPPVIFDFVNNFRSIRAKDFLYELDFYRKQESDLRNEAGLPEKCPAFHIIDETRKITEVFGKIDFELDVWDSRYEELKNYKQAHGQCSIPQDCAPEHQRLRQWLLVQRIKQKHRLLDEKRENLLSELGVSWITRSLRRTDWETCFDLLVKYKKAHGHCNVKQRDRENHVLAMWVANQRDANRYGYLKAERKKRLEELGFEWCLQYRFDTRWEEKFQELIKYKEEFGHSNVPAKWPRNKKLAIWVISQRKNYKSQRFITSDKIERLNAIGFVWDPETLYWNEQLEKIICFKKEHGHTNVPNSSSSANTWKQLGGWVSIQRRLYSQKRLPENKVSALDAIGFDWAPQERRWNEMYEKLLTFQLNNGHMDVMSSDDKQLYVWVTNQKRALKKNSGDPGKIKKLQAIGLSVPPLNQKSRMSKPEVMQIS